MAKRFFCMPADEVEAYAQTKTDLLTARSKMSKTEVVAASDEILLAAEIYDIGSELYTLQDGVATIPVKGMLTSKVDVCDAFFGETVTTYGFISAAIGAADKDPDVTSISLAVNSAGGSLHGLSNAYASIVNSQKPIISRVEDMAASAAYWLASGTDEIVATVPTGFFGSIGVAVELINRDKLDDSIGIKRTVLTNKESLDKHPDLTTDDGLAIVRSELDDIYEVFASDILRKRPLTKKKIDELSGRVLIAADAGDFGLIDTVDFNVKDVKNIEILEKKEDPDMESDEKKKDPAMESDEKKENTKEAEDTGVSEKEARMAGVKAERERVEKLLSFGSVPNNIALAVSKGISVQDYALAQLESQKAAREMAAENAENNFGKLAKNEAVATTALNETDRVIEAFDRMLGAAI